MNMYLSVACLLDPRYNTEDHLDAVAPITFDQVKEELIQIAVAESVEPESSAPTDDRLNDATEGTFNHSVNL